MKNRTLKQRNILEAAQRVLSAAPEEATMDRIAKEAGVAKGTLFLYYPGKEALVDAVRDDLMNAFIADLESIRDSGTGGEELLRAAASSVVTHLHRKIGLMDALGERSSGCAHGGRSRAPAVLAALKEILEKCAADGLIRLEDPLYAASAFFGLCRGSRAYLRGAGRSLSAREKADRAVRIFLGGVRRK